MERRRQSIMKQDGRMTLQETLMIPDFPEEDTATVTVTKSRRVSFGANFVKEFIVGSAVSTQFFTEYEQAVSSSDSSNPNSSRSGILDRTSYHEENALNLSVKSTNQDELGPLKKKYCLEKSNGYSEFNDRNNKNIWEFNVKKCLGDTESESDMSIENFSNYFPIPKGSAPDEEFDESHENIENVPIHMYSMNVMLGQGDNSQGDAEMEKSLFFPEKSLTAMLRSDPYKATLTDFSSINKDDTDECDMEISSSNVLKETMPDSSSMDRDNTEECDMEISSSDILKTSEGEEESKQKSPDPSPVKLTSDTTDPVPEAESLSIEINSSINKVLEDPDNEAHEVTDNRCPLLEDDNHKTDSLESNNCASKLDLSVSPDTEESIDSPRVGERSGMEATQETQFWESSFMDEVDCDDNDGISLGDKKIIALLTEQSEEANCCWKIDSINSLENFWLFSFPILKNSAVMKFKLMPPNDKSLISFSLILESSLELKEPNEYQLQKDRIGIEFIFGKLRNDFHRESRELENVHKMPLFLDKMNLIMKKLNGILNQVICILKNYPGSHLKKSILSFRIYSLPLLFSYLVSIDMTDPLQLSEKSISMKKHFGNFRIGLVKSIFCDCLGNDEFLINFIRTLTNAVVEMEREIGSITKRSHIRLIT